MNRNQVAQELMRVARLLIEAAPLQTLVYDFGMIGQKNAVTFAKKIKSMGYARKVTHMNRQKQFVFVLPSTFADIGLIEGEAESLGGKRDTRFKNPSVQW